MSSVRRRSVVAAAGKAAAFYAAAMLVLAAGEVARAEPQPTAKGQEQPSAGKRERPSLQDRICRLVAGHGSDRRATIGVSVLDVRSRAGLVNIRQGELFIPASNQKLLTSAFALARLGEQFKFTTRVWLLGKDVVVQGDFDPALGDGRLARAAGGTIYDQLDQWADAIGAKTRGRVGGNIVVIVRADRAEFRHRDWPTSQHRRWYAAPVATLNFNNNCLDVSFRADKEVATAVFLPVSRFFQVVNNVRFRAGRRWRWSLGSNRDDSVITLQGTIGRRATAALSVAINHPPLLVGRVLAERLLRAQVKFSGKILTGAGIDLSGASPVWRTTTPLAVAMRRANKRSMNMAAECIFLRAGDGTWAGSAAIAAATLAADYALDRRQFHVSDGSGLSRKNRVTPGAVTKLLAGILNRPGGRILLDSLPVSGTDGSMSRRLRRRPYRGRVLGKTGHLASVSCLSGYVLDRAGKAALAFSLLMNRTRSAKGLQDAICRLLVDWLDEQQAGKQAAA